MSTDYDCNLGTICASPQTLYDMVQLQAMATGIAKIVPQNGDTTALHREVAHKLRRLIQEGELRKAINDARERRDRVALQSAKSALHALPAATHADNGALANRANRLIKTLTADPRTQKSLRDYVRCSRSAVPACRQAHEVTDLQHLNELLWDKIATLSAMQQKLNTAAPSRWQEADELKNYIKVRGTALEREIALRDTLIGAKMTAAAAYACNLDPGASNTALTQAKTAIDEFFAAQRDLLSDTYGNSSIIGDPCLRCIDLRVAEVTEITLAGLDFTTYSSADQFDILQNLYTQRGGSIRYGEGEINVIGVRGLDNRGDRKGKVGGEVTGQYDDTIFVLVTHGGVKQVYSFPATTQPGIAGDEIVAKGLYNYQIGAHYPRKGTAQYKVGRELGASASKRAFWDHDDDGRLSDADIWQGLRETGEIDVSKLSNTNNRDRGGFNIHAGGTTGEWAQLGTWSLGCQVIPDTPVPPATPTDGTLYFADFRALLLPGDNDQINANFTYALVDVRDLVQVINGGQITESHWVPGG